MFPPLEPEQVPEIWFCPVCVARNWHVPPTAAIQTPPTTLPSTSVTSTPLSLTEVNLDTANQKDVSSPVIHPPAEKQAQTPRHTTGAASSSDNTDQNERWRQAQRWKENSWYAPRGYVLDSSNSERFIPISGEGPAITLDEVLKNRSTKLSSEVNTSNEPPERVSDQGTAVHGSQGKLRRPGRPRNKSPPRKRSKYSDLPSEVERAFDLIKSHLEGVSKNKRSHEDVENRAKILEQKMKIQEGEIFICHQELQAVKQKLSEEVSTTEKLKGENAALRKEVEELRELAQRKESQLKNWQNMLRTMVNTEEQIPAG